ncbi:MAG: hypothetical protein WA851_21755 [Xanthobacteraceae bacterium]
MECNSAIFLNAGLFDGHHLALHLSQLSGSLFKRILPPLLRELDGWIAGNEKPLSRPGAIRQLIEHALGLAKATKQKRSL